MQASAWLSLFKWMPQEQHDNLSLVTSTGIEVALQQIVRLERDFMVVRGRLTGTMDTGLIIVVPYDQIAYMNFVKKMVDEEVNELFKNYKAAAPAAVPNVAAQPAKSVPEEEFLPIRFSARKEEKERPAESEELEEVVGASGKSGSKGKPISKTMMLARLRARLAVEKAPPPD